MILFDSLREYFSLIPGHAEVNSHSTSMVEIKQIHPTKHFSENSSRNSASKFSNPKS